MNEIAAAKAIDFDDDEAGDDNTYYFDAWTFNWHNDEDWNEQSNVNQLQDNGMTDKVDEELKKQIAEGLSEKCTPIIPGLDQKVCLSLTQKNIGLRFAAGSDEEISDMLYDFYSAQHEYYADEYYYYDDDDEYDEGDDDKRESRKWSHTQDVGMYEPMYYDEAMNEGTNIDDVDLSSRRRALYDDAARAYIDNLDEEEVQYDIDELFDDGHIDENMFGDMDVDEMDYNQEYNQIDLSMDDDEEMLYDIDSLFEDIDDNEEFDEYLTEIVDGILTDDVQYDLDELFEDGTSANGEYFDELDYDLYADDDFEEEYDQIADELDALYSMYDEYDLYHYAYYDAPNSLDPALQTALNTELSTLGQLDFSNNDDWDSIQIINNAAPYSHRRRRRRMQAAAPQTAAAAPAAPKAAAAPANNGKPDRKDVFKEGYEMGQLMKPQEQTQEKLAEKSIKKKIMDRLTRFVLFCFVYIHSLTLK